MTIITTEFKVIEDKNDEPTLEDAQAFVEGWVEPVWLSNGDLLLINEESVMRGLPVNEIASVIARQPILGNAMVIKKDALKDMKGWRA